MHTDLETHESVPYLAMELVQEGIPLTTYADDHELTVVERLRLFCQVCEAIGHAHAAYDPAVHFPQTTLAEGAYPFRDVALGVMEHEGDLPAATFLFPILHDP